MKKTNLYLTLILVALITVILITGILLIVVLGSSDSENNGTDDTSVTVSTVEKTPAPGTTTKTPSTTPITPSNTTTAPSPSTTTTIASPSTTTKPAPTPTTTTKPVTTTKPATTTTPVTPTPIPGGASGVIAGDKAGSLGIYAAYTTESSAADKDTITVKVTFYAESYGLRIGARTDNYLLVNGKKISGLDSDAINLPDKTPLTQSVLYEYETTVKKNGNSPVTLELEFFWHFQASYSGVHAEWLSVKVDLAF